MLGLKIWGMQPLEMSQLGLLMTMSRMASVVYTVGYIFGRPFVVRRLGLQCVFYWWAGFNVLFSVLKCFIL